jgi:hypothetical protein
MTQAAIGKGPIRRGRHTRAASVVGAALFLGAILCTRKEQTMTIVNQTSQNNHKRRIETMTNTLDEGRIVRYSFTIDFAEQDVETYPLDALAAEEVDGDREAIKAGLLATHTDAIHRAAERITALIQSDEILDSILTAHDIGLVMGLSH